MSRYILHNYFRSTTSLRVRVALNMKGLEYEYKAYALLDRAHKSETYLKLNPQGLVPALELSGETVLTQSMAILEYLDEVHPSPPLLPTDPLARARVRALSQIIAIDIHPINNLRVLKYLQDEFGADQQAKTKWFCHWAAAGMAALETRLGERETGTFCHGDTPTLADICLYAQMFNNQRFGLDISPYPRVENIYNNCAQIKEFADAAPLQQPDAPELKP
ncbi:MAG TPA: maleylacetoacetate isomerase [Hellea balneolensis]|uniref:Maleylacetoacetate isomerase n=1 Tax=Hellea balneolensis TaxID=287478 RepID=A0A7C5R856_9PROT|nr:maleylacetoacetate isomerase [Hellea balneolensis]